MSEVIIAMRRKGKTMVLAMCLATVAGCAQHQVLKSGQAKWARANKKANKNVPEYIPPNILPQTHFAAARLLEKQGQVDDAIVQYRKVIALNHGFIAAYHRLGILLSASGRHSEATTSLRKAVELSPRHAILRNDLGAELMFREHWADAEHEFLKATEFKPNFARAHVNRGIALTRLGRFDEARRAFKTVLPEPDALYNLGLMYRGQKRFTDAVKTFREVLDIDPNFMAARMQLNQVAKLVPSSTNNEMDGPHNSGMRRMTQVMANTSGENMRKISRRFEASDASLPFDVQVAQKRREQEIQNRQAKTLRRQASQSSRRNSHVNQDNYVAKNDTNKDDAEKLAPMLKFFRPKAQAQMQQQRQAQAEIVNERRDHDAEMPRRATQASRVSASQTLAVLPYDSPCFTEDYSPGDDENFEAMVDDEIRSGRQDDAHWPAESFLHTTMASRIVAQFWSEADVTSENYATSVNFSIGHSESLYEIEALVAAEEPCRDTIDEDDSTLQKFAAVQRVHQNPPFDNTTSSVGHKNTKKIAPSSMHKNRTGRKSKSMTPEVKSQKQHRKSKMSPRGTGRSMKKSKASASNKNLRMSRKNAVDQQWQARHMANKISPSARTFAASSPPRTWRDCDAEPAVASAAYMAQDAKINYSVNVRMALRVNEQTLEQLREDRRCLVRSLAERQVTDMLVAQVDPFESVMFGAGMQIPDTRDMRLGSRLLSSDVVYIPSAPGFTSNVNLLSSDMVTTPNRLSPNRRTTLSSTVMSGRRALANGHEQYIQDFDLQMSVPSMGYPERFNGYDDYSIGQWSLDPTIMDAPLEVLINETNCWEDQRRSDGVVRYHDDIDSYSSSAQIQSNQDFSFSQFADVRKRDRVETEDEGDEDNQKNDRPTQRRAWFKP